MVRSQLLLQRAAKALAGRARMPHASMVAYAAASQAPQHWMTTGRFEFTPSQAYPLSMWKRTMSTASVEEFPEFEDLESLHPSSKASLKNMGLTTMTEIQSKTWEAAVAGKDVLGRARTGTGKTVAFLLPAIERIVRNPVPDQVNVLILSPTRELASQIAEQARSLMASHGRNLSHQVVFGGSPRSEDVRRFQSKIPNILVATPGRLRDHLQSTDVHRKPFPSYFENMEILVLDETDRLLDMGFKQEVDDIISYLPRKRQTLLFSATLPPDVRSVLANAMNPDFVTVDCIHDSDPASHTNAQVKQSHVILRTESELVKGTVEIIQRIMDEPDSKMIVFFPTTNMVTFYSNLFNFGLGRNVLEIHSKKTQAYRTNASNRFRQLERGALFSSDVSARGVDYPNVTHVVQVGIADSRESYIHRLGRTARAGKMGQGILILSDLEKKFIRTLTGLDIPVNKELHELLKSPSSEKYQASLEVVLNSIRNETNRSLVGAAEEACRSLLGYYKNQFSKIGVRDTESLVHFANSFSQQTGLKQTPSISPKVARSLGIDRFPGVNISNYDNYDSPRRSSSMNGGRRPSQGDSFSGSGSYDDWGRSSQRGPGGYDSPRGYDRPRSYDGPRGYDRPSSYDGQRGYDRPRSYDGPRGYDRPRSNDGPRSYDRPRNYDGPMGYDEPKSYDTLKAFDAAMGYDKDSKEDSKPKSKKSDALWEIIS